MSNFLIEIPHSDNIKECKYAIQVFLESGSHLLANADWGCSDGEHKTWLIIDTDTREQARQIVPPLFREHAKITKLVKFIKESTEEGLKYHQA